MNNQWIRLVALALVLVMSCPVSLLAAVTPVPTKETKAAEEKPEPSPAPSKHVKTLKAAAKAGLLGEEILAKKTMTDVEVTDALVALFPVVTKIDPKTLKPGMENQDVVTYEALLDLVVEKKGAIRARNLSAYTMEKRLQGIITALTDTGEVKNIEEAKVVSTPTRVVSSGEGMGAMMDADWKAIRGSLDKVTAELSDMRKAQEMRFKEVEKAGIDDRTKVAAVQDDLSLIRDNLDALQENLKGIGDRVESMAKKVDEKGLDAEGQKREWTIMRKDIRDHSQDLSALKQKVEKLMAPEKSTASALDKALTSKWVPGAAILLSLGAIALAASK